MKKLFVGNWKMNKNEKEAIFYCKKFKTLVKNDKNEIVLAVPFTLLKAVKNAIGKSNLKIAAQDIFYKNEGAFTGEVSGKMIKDYASYVIIGHSERRKYFNETNEIINMKIKAALENKLKVILCIGETFNERRLGITFDVIGKQLEECLSGIDSDIIIAYEPVWAIGTGKTATTKQAQETHSFIRKQLQKLYGEKAEKIRIIYGGSVTPENAKELLEMKDIDGCLPGGSSLDPIKFSRIIKSAN